MDAFERVLVSSKEVRTLDEFQNATRFFEEVTTVGSGLDTAFGYLPNDKNQVREAMRLWKNWRKKHWGNRDTDILICLVDRYVKHDYLSIQDEPLLEAVSRQPWIGFEPINLGSYGHERIGKENFVFTVLELGPRGRFSQVSWRIIDISSESIQIALDRPFDEVALGFWTLTGKNRITVQFTFIDPSLSSEGGRPIAVVRDLTWTESGSLSFLGTRFDPVDRYPELHVSDIWLGVSRLREANERLLLWLVP